MLHAQHFYYIMTFLELPPLYQRPYDDQEQQQQQPEDDYYPHFTIPLLESDDVVDDDVSSDTCNNRFPVSIPQNMIDSFQKEGFVVFRHVVSTEGVDALNDRLEDVLRGVYDRGRKPDKIPRLVKGDKPQAQALPVAVAEIIKDQPSSVEVEEETITTTTTATITKVNKKQQKKKRCGMGPIGFSGNTENVKVLQIINIHKADSLFRKLETNADLANIVAQLAGWEGYGGARLAQDQIWGKPPGAPPLVFHRDTPYFMFEPSDVVTVWIALDDMDTELGPLEYVPGSHLWGDGRVGSANQFFQTDTKKLVRSAAEREGIDPDALEFVSMAGMKNGGLSIHHGKIWHGSAKNCSRDKPRRGLGLHFVPANVKFTSEAAKSILWKSYVTDVEDLSTIELSEEDFPISTSIR